MRSGSYSVNPYEVLGVSQDASYAEIQAAYRQHALRWHPDRNANDDYAYRMMLRVNAAWAILKDEESRAAYDRWEQRGEKRSESGTRGWSHRERDAGSSHGGGAYRPPGPPPPSVMTCARCDSTNEVGSVYCYSCGYPFDEEDRRRDSSAQINREQRAQKANSRSGLPADNGQRICAFFIDAFIVLVLSSFTVSFLLDWYDLPDEPFFGGRYGWIFLAVPGLYFTVLVAAWATTLGKRIFGLQVVRTDGSKVGFGRALSRCVCNVMLLSIISGLVIVFRSDKRGLHDLICDTKVVYR